MKNQFASTMTRALFSAFATFFLVGTQISAAHAASTDAKSKAIIKIIEIIQEKGIFDGIPYMAIRVNKHASTMCANSQWLQSQPVFRVKEPKAGECPWQAKANSAALIAAALVVTTIGTRALTAGNKQKSNQEDRR